MLQELQEREVGRIILAQPPEFAESVELPGWSSVLASRVPVFVPARHRFAEISPNKGFVEIVTDSDGVLRRDARPSVWAQHASGAQATSRLRMQDFMISTRKYRHSVSYRGSFR